MATKTVTTANFMPGRYEVVYANGVTQVLTFAQNQLSTLVTLYKSKNVSTPNGLMSSLRWLGP